MGKRKNKYDFKDNRDRTVVDLLCVRCFHKSECDFFVDERKACSTYRMLRDRIFKKVR
jgi:hypothetical protein